MRIKNILLGILIFICTNSVLAQNYIPFEMSVGTYWRNSSYNCCFNANSLACIAEHYSEVVSDTNIAGMKYYKIKKGYLSNNASGNCLGANYTVTHFLREDTLNKKVYERIWSGTDTVIMDFSQQIGDTCNLYYYNYANSFVVTSIDSILINSVYHKRINYGSNQFSLIEGIGSTLGITELWNDFENYTSLICKGKNGVTQYPDNILNLNSCNPVQNLGIRAMNEVENILEIYPNPSQSLVRCTLKNKKIHVAKIYDLLGNLIVVERYDSPSVIIDISTYDNGIYFIVIDDEEQNLYFKKLIKN